MALTYLDTAMIEQPTVFPELSVTGLQIGNITSSTSVIGDLTIYGTLTALSGFNVVIASTTSTSALSVSNIQARPALDVYQGPAHPIISVFKNNTGSIVTIGSTGIMVSGSMGIGTASPSTKLQVTNATAIDTYIRTTNSITASGFDVGVASTGDAFVYNRNNTSLGFGTGNIQRMQILSGGDVGIGTTTPTAQLHVQSLPSASGRWVVRGNIQNVPNDTGIFADGLNNMLLDARDASGTVRVSLKSSGTSFLSGGNVGIGFTTPSAKLHVRATTSLDGLFLDGGANYSWLRVMPGNLVSQGSYNGITQTGDNTIIYTSGVMNSGSLVIAPWANTTGGIRMLSSGIVGIGTPFPNQTLTVAGNISATGTASVSALNIVSGRVFPKTTFNNLVSALAINVNGTVLYMPLLSAI